MSRITSDSTSPLPDRHPSLGALLLFLEGELDQHTNAKVKAHTSECWLCRTRCEHLRTGRSKFVNYWQEVLIPSVLLPPKRKPEVRRMLRDQMLAHQTTVRRAPRRWAVGVAAAAAIACFLLIPLSSPPKVSAAKFLDEAIVASSRALEPPPGHVIRQHFAFQQGDIHVGRTIWRGVDAIDDKTPEPQESILRQSLEVSGINWRDPINPHDFIEWRNAQNIAREEVTETAEYLVLHTTVGGNRNVREVTLTVNRSTWQPVARSAEFFHAPSLQVQEVAFTIEPSVAPVVTASSNPVALRNSPVARTIREQPTPTDDLAMLEETELKLHELFHAAGADVQEVPEVWQAKGSVHFRFTDVHSERVRDLVDRAERMPLVAVFPAPTRPAPNGEMRHIGVTSVTEPPLAKRLTKYFGGLERSNAYLDSSRDFYLRALMESTALNRLYDRYSNHAMDSLSAEQQLRVESMAMNHIVRLRAESRQYLSLLSPVLDHVLEAEGIPDTEAGQLALAGCLSPRQIGLVVTADLQELQRNFRLLFVPEQTEDPAPLDPKLLLRRASDNRFLMQENLRRLCLSR